MKIKDNLDYLNDLQKGKKDYVEYRYEYYASRLIPVVRSKGRISFVPVPTVRNS